MVVVAAVCVFTAVTCSSERQTQRPAGGAGGQTTAVSGGGGSGIAGGIVVTIDAAVTPPTGTIFSDPPIVPCDPSVPDGGGCELAPSLCETPVCDDAGSCTPTRWLKAFANPRCVSGRCVWDPVYYNCGDLCVNGRCIYNGTTLP